MATVTANDLITESLALMGEYAPGEPLDAAAVTTMIFTLNGILDGLGAERLALFANWTAAVTVPPGPAFTLLPPVFAGTGAPADLTGVGVMVDANVERPVRMLTSEEFRRIALKSMTGVIPEAVWVHPANGSITINLWPVPSQLVFLKLYYSYPLASVASGTDVVAMPPGYQELLTYELAIKAAPKFGANLPPWIYSAWQQAKTRVKENNFEAVDSRTDPALSWRGRGSVPAERLSFYSGE